jgi:multidrug efflux pump subunit AcrA (membrane-fusion protein)
MTVSIRLPLASATDAVSVPVGAVFETRRGKVVYVVRPDGTNEPRPVEVGAADLFHAEILSGLQEGESVLLSRPDDEKP